MMPVSCGLTESVSPPISLIDRPSRFTIAMGLRQWSQRIARPSLGVSKDAGGEEADETIDVDICIDRNVPVGHGECAGDAGSSASSE
jgi:hypothetical protein